MFDMQASVRPIESGLRGDDVNTQRRHCLRHHRRYYVVQRCTDEVSIINLSSTSSSSSSSSVLLSATAAGRIWLCHISLWLWQSASTGRAKKSTPNEFSDFSKTAQSYHYITLHYIKCLVPCLQQTGPARQYSSRYPYPIISIITVYNYYNHRNYNTRGSQKVLSLII